MIGDVVGRVEQMCADVDIMSERRVERVVGLNAGALEKLVAADAHHRVQSLSRNSSSNDGKASLTTIEVGVGVQGAQPRHVGVKRRGFRVFRHGEEP